MRTVDGRRQGRGQRPRRQTPKGDPQHREVRTSKRNRPGPEFDRGYTTNEDGSTTAFRLSSLKTLKRINLAETADSAVYEPVTKPVAFTFGDTKQISSPHPTPATLF